jgi:hypothetical protein
MSQSALFSLRRVAAEGMACATTAVQQTMSVSNWSSGSRDRRPKPKHALNNWVILQRHAIVLSSLHVLLCRPEGYEEAHSLGAMQHTTSRRRRAVEAAKRAA